jgi:alkylation response protein AidB-like acyl-CoA dehydrogenase
MSEIAEIRALARDFARAELRPHVERWDHECALGPGVAPQLGELGFFGMLVPESDGGMGFGPATFVAALEEIAWGEPATALLLLAQQLAAQGLTHAPADVRSQWLGALATGDALGCYATGDSARDALTAQRAGDGWIVSGEAPWVLHHGTPSIAIVEAAVGDGSALFAVPLDAAATFGERADTLGLRSLNVAPMRLADAAAVALADDAAPHLQRIGRVGVAATGIGIAQAALDHALAYAAQREQFRTRLRDFDAIRFKLADMAIGIRAARALLQEAAAESADAIVPAMAKVVASRLAVDATTEAVQVFGGYGYMRDYPVEKLMRDARALGLLHGADELLRLDIAGSLYQD